ncbi:Beta-lactamase-like protein [Corchorus olitorius]|uniref:Beta-lactamase-like protein n=1 Tax=Corchorus olitorius TaxID=93759 RepID=A0A1R3FWJ1_9ROSI|nr:Beta-lactamase-like protein [Corchorus olitorius]
MNKEKMATHNLAVILKNQLNDDEFLLLKQTPPPKFGEDEYDSYVDSDLWDLPSTLINLQDNESQSGVFIKGAESLYGKIDSTKFDVELGLARALEQVGHKGSDVGEWSLFKYVEEAEFGPGNPVNTVFLIGKLLGGNQSSQGVCKWMSTESCLNLLLELKPCNGRLGPLVVVGLINDSLPSAARKLPPTLQLQEYPPGVILVPMRSRTVKPFHTTNLVIFAPENVSDTSGDCGFVAHGDALIVDPGCRREYHEELKEIVTCLPKKLIVFVTHHHPDHVEGLSIIQKCNPNATLLAHEHTMRRIGKGDWSLGYTSASGDEDIWVGGKRLTVIFAPGHTDGHLALLDVSTNSLIVGDHCVGHGSAALDVTSGGNMTDYFRTTYKFMELSPHALIPMHGRVNLWPKNMLCGYLKNRRSREATILNTIENGAETLFDIVSKVYSGVDQKFWISAASNVRLHVDHLAQQKKLPKNEKAVKSIIYVVNIV